MIKVKFIQSTGTPVEAIVDETTKTVRGTMEEYGIDYTGKQIAMDGVFLSATEIGGTFASLNAKDTVIISVLTKLNNA